MLFANGGKTMDEEKFLNWLQIDKGISLRSARDVLSRCRRITFITKVKEIDVTTMDKLLKSKEFNGFTTTVKSQLKRAITLYLEYKN